jgi:hypothetical protein
MKRGGQSRWRTKQSDEPSGHYKREGAILARVGRRLSQEILSVVGIEA